MMMMMMEVLVRVGSLSSSDVEQKAIVPGFIVVQSEGSLTT